jgi:hypothetical protein
VGIYAGKGKIVHASDYFNKVTESEMKYIKGYVGASRMLVNGKPVKQSVERSAERSVDPSPDEAPKDASPVASEKEASPPPTKTQSSSSDQGSSRGSSSSTGSVSQKTETSQRIWVEKVANSRTQVQHVSQPGSEDPEDSKEKVNTTNAEVTDLNEHEDQERSPGED